MDIKKYLNEDVEDSVQNSITDINSHLILLMSDMDKNIKEYTRIRKSLSIIYDLTSDLRDIV